MFGLLPRALGACIVASFASLLLLVTASAYAQPRPPAGDPAQLEASAYFRRGVELFQAREFAAALAEFQRAYEVAPNYRVLYNIAQAKLALSDYLGAAAGYERYLAEAGAELTEPRRGDVMQTLAMLEQRIGGIAIRVDLAGAELFVDGAAIGTAPLAEPVPANAGAHRVEARSPEGRVDARSVEVVGGDVVRVEFALAPPPPPVRAPIAPLGRSRARKVSIALLALSGAAFAGSATALALTLRSDRELERLARQNTRNDRPAEDEREARRRRAIAAEVLVAMGGAAAIAGVLTWVLERPRRASPERSELRVGITAQGVQLLARF